MSRMEELDQANKAASRKHDEEVSLLDPHDTRIIFLVYFSFFQDIEQTLGLRHI